MEKKKEEKKGKEEGRLKASARSVCLARCADAQSPPVLRPHLSTVVTLLLVLFSRYRISFRQIFRFYYSAL